MSVENSRLPEALKKTIITAKSAFERSMAKVRGEKILQKDRIKIDAPKTGEEIGLTIKGDAGDVKLAIRVENNRAFLFNPDARQNDGSVLAVPFNEQAGALILDANFNHEQAIALGIYNLNWGQRKIMIGMSGDAQNGFQLEMNAQNFGSGEHPKVKISPKKSDSSLFLQEFAPEWSSDDTLKSRLQVRRNPALNLPRVMPDSSAPVSRAPTKYLAHDATVELMTFHEIIGGQLRQSNIAFPVEFKRSIDHVKSERRKMGKEEPELIIHRIHNEQILLGLMNNQEIHIGGRLIKRETLLKLISEGQGQTGLSKFSAHSKENNHDVRMMYLPVFEKNGDVVVFQIDLNSYGRLKDVLSPNLNVNETRMAVSSGLKINQTSENNTNYQKPETGEAEKSAKTMHFQEVEGVIKTDDAEFNVQMVTTNGDRKIDEDMTYALPIILPDGRQLIFFGVNDGMGGHGNGDKASMIALSASYEWICALSRNDKGMQEFVALRNEARKRHVLLGQVLLEKMIAIENEVVNSWRLAAVNNAGTTRTGGIILGEKAFIGGIGDSRTYYSEPNLEDLHQVTRDHSLVQSLVDTNQLKPTEVFDHPQRNQIYRNIGDRPRVEIDKVKVVDFSVGATVVSCCDGLWEVLRDIDGDKMTKFVFGDGGLIKTVHEAAKNKDCGDNISGVMVTMRKKN